MCAGSPELSALLRASGPQESPYIAPRSLKIAPREPQESPKRAPTCPKRVPRGPKRAFEPQERPKNPPGEPQESSKRAPRDPKRASTCPKTAPRGPKRAPRGSKMTPRWHQDGSTAALGVAPSLFGVTGLQCNDIVFEFAGVLESYSRLGTVQIGIRPASVVD